MSNDRQTDGKIWVAPRQRAAGAVCGFMHGLTPEEVSGLLDAVELAIREATWSTRCDLGNEMLRHEITKEKLAATERELEDRK